jgi:hypothetical protein
MKRAVRTLVLVVAVVCLAAATHPVSTKTNDGPMCIPHFCG